MDLLRSESLGRLNNELYERVVQTAVGGARTTPELLGVLSTKYFIHADVRYFTLRAVDRLCSSLAAGPGPASGKGSKAAGGLTASDDLTRNIFGTKFAPFHAFSIELFHCHGASSVYRNSECEC